LRIVRSCDIIELTGLVRLSLTESTFKNVLICGLVRIVARVLCSLSKNRNCSRLRAILMSPSGVHLAVRHVRHSRIRPVAAVAVMETGVAIPQPNARCSPPNVLSVAKIPRYPSNLVAIGRYTALTAIVGFSKVVKKDRV
jgi:hypothetical protein